ncbi:hypothetical protein OEA41_007444 [Lepraria neglecta]|uniref:Uncharacterized protein n=1 Tax=Lepraria neglecta TaxID=209136 RepID=A0AAD9ZCT2_9LECA|nr:hypothetical protein OEA41_007444 [Lepraria neglecta]
MPSSIGLSLTTVDLWDHFASYDIVVKFSALRTVRSIAGNNFKIAYDSRDPFDNPLPSKSSNVESVVFDRSNVDSKWLTPYLSGLKSLRVFRCSSTSQDHWQPSFDPFRIRAALLAQAKESIEVLELNSDRGEGHYIGSLSQFEALRELHTSQHQLLDHMLMNWCSKQVDMLPASLESLTVNFQDLRDHYSLHILVVQMGELKAK